MNKIDGRTASTASTPLPAFSHVASSGQPTPSPPTSATSAEYRLPGVEKRFSASQVNAGILANRLIDVCHEHGEVVTNLRLQKLLYYAQAWHLALRGVPLFPEDFEAWPNGPIQPDVYAEFRHFGTRPIDRVDSGIRLPKKIEEHIKDLLQSYGRLSPFELDLLSCEESPWRDARSGLQPDEPSRRIIPQAAMKTYYKLKLDGKKQ